MKKQILLSFLAGAVLPLMLAALFQKTPPVPEAESESIGPAQSIRESDPETVLTVVNRAGNLQQMTLREYLVGVVLSEMPADFEPEALKAQAVVARTYTRKRMEGSKHGEAAVCMDPGCCQGWQSGEDYLEAGGRERSLNKVRSAVADTDGLVLRYDGRLIDATYFSCSGGTTEDAVAVWGQDVPYLRSVESPGEEEAPRFTDSVSFTSAEFAGKLGLSGEGDPGSWFGATTHTAGGGVETMVIRGKTFTGTQLRSKLGLRSTAFEVAVSGKTITVTTRGFGHRVGMSQYGAQAMAQSGSTYDEILAHYYSGAELFREGD
ncbi:MAG: stage II sporulation protein D [Oscillospiraceae bacterium]|nr:stage II sporulation protein D [Oscillospiraceae bacterium]